MSVSFRSSLVISQPQPGEALQQGEEGFERELLRHYNETESAALEQVIQFKTKLRRISDDDFWFTFCEGLARIVDAQYVLVSKRLDDSPPVGDAGSCLLALCWFYDNGHGVRGAANNINYHAFSCPCSLMSHRKVLLIPDRLNETFPNNPNNDKLAFPAEAYLAIPLFDGEKCVAHIGMLFTLEALERRKLGWGFLEMLCHALEDIVLQRFLAGVSFPEQTKSAHDTPAIPIETIAALHSLKPFARNLSHELRTPMQGIVGMLDIMYATIHDAVQSQTTAEAALVFDELKDSLEVIQASAKRAIDASDNVVQAYALNMGLPEMTLPTPPVDAPYANSGIASVDVPGESSHARGVKRQREQHEDHYEASTKPKRTNANASTRDEWKDQMEMAVPETDASKRQDRYSPSLLFSNSPGLQYVNVRDVINFVVSESLKASGNSSTSAPSVNGHTQRVEVQATLGDGSQRSKMVEWTVQPGVPDFILVDERIFAKMLSCVFQNAVKFTESGLVKLDTRFCQKRQYVIITVKDTGPGIPEHFRRRIFKPFAREDDSTTRQNEGLGLGLLVAKGLSRKLGGDLLLLSSDTSGDNRGCEFEMKIPVSLGPPNQAAPPSPTRRDEGPMHFSRPTTSPRQPGTTPSSSSSRSSDRLFSGQATDLDTSTDSELISSHRLPHSPPLSPGCSTCSLSEKQLCPPTLPEKKPIPHTLEPIAEASSSSETSPTIPPPQTSPSARKTPLLRRTSQLFDRDLAASHPLTFLVAEDNPVNRKLLVSMLTKLGYDPRTQIYEAYDGADAVRKVQAATQEPAEGEGRIKGPIDVVLMDLWMPAMDGYEAAVRILGMFRPRKPMATRTMSAPNSVTLAALAARQPAAADGGQEAEAESGAGDAASVKEGSSGSEIDEEQQAREWRTTIRARELLPPTILAVTADATDSAVEKAKSAGMEGFMVKPFRLTELEKLIREGWARREKGLEARRVDVLG